MKHPTSPWSNQGPIYSETTTKSNGSLVSISTPSALPQTTQSQSVILAGSYESGSEGSTSQSPVIAGSTPVVPALASSPTSESVSESSSSAGEEATTSTAVKLGSDNVEVTTKLSAATPIPPSGIITEATVPSSSEMTASEESTEDKPSLAPGEIQTVFKVDVTTSSPIIGAPGTKESAIVDRQGSATTNAILAPAETQSQEGIVTSLHTTPSSFSEEDETVDHGGTPFTPLFNEGLPIRGEETTTVAETGMDLGHTVIGEAVEIPGV